MAKSPATRKSSTRRSAASGGRPRGPGVVDAAGKALVIVESPAKARTINRYLGDRYVVRASMGHVRDLPQRDFGVDLTKDFQPTYVVLTGRSRLVGELKKMAGQADAVFLATDLDREGEAIAWHLSQALGLSGGQVGRVIFNQITKAAIEQSFRQPHAIDMDKVNAQQARRILDRIVGYQVSPLLWRKVRRGLSAGRVQTVAVRLIVERERAIRAFEPEEFWRVGVELNPDSAEAARRAGEALQKLVASADPKKGPARQELLALYERERLLRGELVEFAGGKFRPHNAADAHAAVEALGRADFAVEKIKSSRSRTRPPGPFTTAALQQAGVNQLGYSASQTMRLAQQLYEGVEVPGEGSVGLITYMRTDSMNLAPEAVAAARSFIENRFGQDYLPEAPQVYAAAAGAQEAHEAIRPTDVARDPASLRDALAPQLWRLYDLIWRRFVACQMAPAVSEIVTVDVRAQWPAAPDQPKDKPAGALLRAAARKLLFDGFLKVAGRREVPEPVLPDGLAEGTPLWPARIDPSQHFTEPPARFSEATLVKELEAKGIGRPSTYAAIIDTIQQRGYVELKDKRFWPTALGEVVTDQLVAAFPHIFDVEFTRFMEAELDKIEGDKADWVAVLREFYEPFSQCLAQAADKMTRPVEPSPHACPKCGKKLLYRLGRTGRFLGCEGYPDCDFTANVNEQGEPVQPKEVDVNCPACGKPMVFRTGRTGPFLGCSGYPECSGTLPCDEQGNPLKLVGPEDVQANCPECSSPMKVKFFRGRSFMGCSRYPQCKATAPIPAGLAVRRPKSEAIETAIVCDKCSKPMVVRSGSKGRFLACTGFPRCRNTRNLTKDELAAVEKNEPLKPAPGEKVGATPPAESNSPAAAKPKAKADERVHDSKETEPAAASTGPDGELADLLKAGCPDCHSPLTLRASRFGPFLGCSNYPTCKKIVKLKGPALKQAAAQLGLPEQPIAKPKPAPTNVVCPKCGKPMVLRAGRTGQFLGCSGYPACRHTCPIPADLTGGG